PRVHPDVRDDQAHAAAEQVPPALASVDEGRFRSVAFGLGGFHEAIHDAGRRGFSTRRPYAASAGRLETPNAAWSEPRDRSRVYPRGRLRRFQGFQAQGSPGADRPPEMHRPSVEAGEGLLKSTGNSPPR